MGDSLHALPVHADHPARGENALVSMLDPEYLPTLIERGQHDGTDHRFEPRSVSATGVHGQIGTRAWGSLEGLRHRIGGSPRGSPGPQKLRQSSVRIRS